MEQVMVKIIGLQKTRGALSGVFYLNLSSRNYSICKLILILIKANLGSSEFEGVIMNVLLNPLLLGLIRLYKLTCDYFND